MNNHEDEKKIIENFDWNQLSVESLKGLQSKIGKALSLKKRDFKLTNSTIEVVQKYKYKASLAKVFPDRQRHSLSEYQNCVFLISLGSRNSIYSERLEACIKWISEQFQTCLVLVEDSLYRLTIEIRQELKGNEAWKTAFHAGKEFIDRHGALFDKYSQNCCFKLRLTSTYAPLPLAEIEELSDIKLYYQELENLYQKNEPFHRTVNLFAQTYLNRSEQIDDIRQKQLAITYIGNNLHYRRVSIVHLPS